MLLYVIVLAGTTAVAFVKVCPATIAVPLETVLAGMVVVIGMVLLLYIAVVGMLLVEATTIV